MQACSDALHQADRVVALMETGISFVHDDDDDDDDDYPSDNQGTPDP